MVIVEQMRWPLGSQVPTCSPPPKYSHEPNESALAYLIPLEWENYLVCLIVKMMLRSRSLRATIAPISIVDSQSLL
ncbi:hypothetical protein CsSME_00037673 [Camellia sinensis var. sinensis]